MTDTAVVEPSAIEADTASLAELTAFLDNV